MKKIAVRFLAGLGFVCLMMLPGAGFAATLFADSTNDFTTSGQGINGWYYGFYDNDIMGGTFDQLAYVVIVWGSCWGHSASVDWGSVAPVIGASDTHPGNGWPGTPKYSVRRWISPISGTLFISGEWGDTDSGGGDGSTCSVRLNGVAIATYDYANGGPVVSYAVTTTVANADIVDFVVDPKGGYGNDTTKFTAVIRGNATGAPIIDNLAPSNVTLNSAALNGSMISTGVSATAVSVYWGTSDGGTNRNAWGHTNDFGVQGTGTFSTNVSLDIPNSLYFYRFSATNDSGEGWATSSKALINGGVGIYQTSDAVESGLKGTFTVYRAISATNVDLTLTYLKTSGTAVSGLDYVALPGTVTIPAGATNAFIALTPVLNWANSSDTALGITLTAGNPFCLFDASSNATLTITNTTSVPSAPTNAWVAASAGNASVSGNWGLGHVPTSSEIVFLGLFSAQNMTWDVTNAVAKWIQTADYNGTVTIATRYDDTFPCMTISGNCQILGGTWTHPVGSSGNTAIYHMRVDVGGDFTLAGAASINLNNKGYAAQYYGGYGPGASGADGNYERGVCHGGLSGLGNSGTYPSLGKVYGSITSPTNLGSSTESAGGGAIHLSVQGTATIDGAVSAAPGGNTTYLAAAAGGSIFMELGYLAGIGSLSVAGQDSGGGGGSGGGGRISVILGNGTDFGSVAMTAHGGHSWAGAFYCGAAGTIYRQRADQAAGRGTLVIDNNQSDTLAATTTPLPVPTLGDALLAYKFVALDATNNANVSILTNITMGNLFLRDDSVRLRLNGNTLTLKAVYHADWGTTNRVVYAGGEIIWDPGAGTVFTIR